MPSRAMFTKIAVSIDHDALPVVPHWKSISAMTGLSGNSDQSADPMSSLRSAPRASPGSVNRFQCDTPRQGKRSTFVSLDVGVPQAGVQKWDIPHSL